MGVPTFISGWPGSASASTKASSGTTGSADAEAQVLRRRTNMGPLTQGPVLRPSAILRPEGRDQIPVPSPRPRLLAPGRGQLLGTVPFHRISCWWRACEWMLEVGILNLCHPSAKYTTASKTKAGDRPGKGHDDPIQCFNKYGAVED